MTLRRLPELAWEAVLLELALYRSLVRWCARRPDVPAGATPVGHAQLVGPMLWLWIFGSATEVVVIPLLPPPLPPPRGLKSSSCPCW